MKPLRVGIVGTGLAAERLHLPALKKLDDLFSLIACASRNLEKAKAFAIRAGIPTVESNAEALLHRDDVDLLLLCLPIELNAQWALKALAAGKPTMSEKPIAATRADAEKLCAAARQKEAPALMVAENFLFWPHMARAVELVKSGALGQVRMAVVHQVQDCRKSGEWFTDWRAKPAFEGGFVLDCGVHWTALLSAMFGEATEVLARPVCSEDGLPPIDTASAIISFGGTRVLWATTYSAAPAAEALISVHGSEGSLAIFWDRTDWRDATGDLHAITSPMDSYEAEWRHFHAVLSGKTPLAYTAAQALKDLDLTLRICGK